MNGAGNSVNRHPLTTACVGALAPRVRKCTGECNRNKSVGQFLGTSTVCIRCARRSA